jgi:hypothetical protein
MLMYVTLTEHERRMLHEFKKRFGGATEWTREAGKERQPLASGL